MYARRLKRPNTFLLMAITLVTLFLEFGICFGGFSATFFALMDKFGKDRAKTSVVHALLLGLSMGLGVVAGSGIHKFGLLRMSVLSSILCPGGFIVSYLATSLQFLYVSIGIVAGFGTALANLCCVTAIVRTVSGKYQALCLCLSTASSGISCLVYTYLIDWSLEHFGLDGTWLILGGLFLHSWSLPVVVFVYRDTLDFYVTHKEEIESCKYETVAQTESQTESDQTNDQLSIVNVLKARWTSFSATFNLPFTLLLIGSGLVAASCNAEIVLVFDIASWKRFPNKTAIYLFTPFAICNVVAIMLCGVIKLRKGISSFVCPIFSISFAILGQFLIYFSTNPVLFISGFCINAVGVGGVFGSGGVLAVKLVPPEQQPIASGLLFTTIGGLITLFGPLFGLIRDETSSYSIVIMVVICIFGIGLLLYIASFYVSRVRPKYRKRNDTDVTIHVANEEN